VPEPRAPKHSEPARACGTRIGFPQQERRRVTRDPALLPVAPRCFPVFLIPSVWLSALATYALPYSPWASVASRDPALLPILFPMFPSVPQRLSALGTSALPLLRVASRYPAFVIQCCPAFLSVPPPSRPCGSVLPVAPRCFPCSPVVVRPRDFCAPKFHSGPAFLSVAPRYFQSFLSVRGCPHSRPQRPRSPQFLNGGWKITNICGHNYCLGSTPV